MEQLLASFVSSFSVLVMILQTSVISLPAPLLQAVWQFSVWKLYFWKHLLHSLSVFTELFLGCDWEVGCHFHQTSFSQSEVSLSDEQLRTYFCACKPEQFFLYALCYVYQYRNWFAFQYHKSLLHLSTGGFQVPWENCFIWEMLVSWEDFVM